MAERQAPTLRTSRPIKDQPDAERADKAASIAAHAVQAHGGAAQQAADIAGIRAFAVHAKDDAARAFYEHFRFVASPSDPFHLFVLMKDLRRIAGT